MTSFSLGPYVIEVPLNRVRRGSHAVQLEPKIMKVLLRLAERHGQVVNKEELIRFVWADTFVSDDVLTRSISVLRKVLDDDSRQPRFIETIPRSGYRLIGPISFATEVTDKVGDGSPADTEGRFVDSGYSLRLWPADTFVDFDQALNNSVQRIGEALGDSAQSPRFIETIPKRGYRFVGSVASPEGETAPEKPEGKPKSWSRTLGIAFAALLILIGTALAVWRWQQTRHREEIRAIAVLPLENLSGDPSQEFFADGITDELITEIAHLRPLRVISRTSVLRYKGTSKSLLEIARELGVDAILEGTVLRSGQQVRVTAQLIDARTDAHLWSQEYTREVRDVLSLQREIAGDVAHQTRLRLLPEQHSRVATPLPIDPEAHDEFLRGRYILGMMVAHLSKKFTDKRQYTDLDILAAIGHFKHAIERDPAYAMAYAGLADAHIQLGHPVWGGHSPKETLAEAKEEATKALDLDPSLADAHFALAQVLQYDWNWSQAEKEYDLALKLNPNYADAHLEYGRFVQALGRNDDALRQMNYAMELNPYDIRTKIYVAWVTWASRQYDLALKQFESLGDDWGMMSAYREKQMYPEAMAALERWKLGHPSQYRHPHVVATAAGICGLEGRKYEAQKLIDELRETARHQYVSGFFFAEAYVGVGQKDQALTWLERAYEDHDQWMVFVAAYPGFDPLRSEPRFQALLRRMHFPPAH